MTYTVLITNPEDSRNLQEVTGYRPIPLCNGDYKFFTKRVTNRSQSVIPDLVGVHQMCRMRRRTINTNIHVARSLLHCCSEDGSPVGMLQVDLEQALDHVWHGLPLSDFEHVDMGDTVFRGVWMAYIHRKTRLILNRKLSSGIEVLSFVRQAVSSVPFNIFA